MPKSPNHGIATSLPLTVLFAMMPCAWSLACLASAGFRLTRYGANAPGQTTSSIITSKAEDFDEKVRASCAYAALESTGCGTSLTLMPVFLENWATSNWSRVWLLPTGPSPRNVIDCPPYFALMALAFGTGGGLTAVAADGAAGTATGPALPAVATLNDVIRANAPVSPTTTSTARCFTSPPSSLQTRWLHPSGSASKVTGQHAATRDRSRAR